LVKTVEHGVFYYFQHIQISELTQYNYFIAFSETSHLLMYIVLRVCQVSILHHSFKQHHLVSLVRLHLYHMTKVVHGSKSKVGIP